MGAPLAHFAINAENMDETMVFYSAVFGWSFQAWGPPGFFQIDSGSGGVEAGGRGRIGQSLDAAIQLRRELLPGTKTVGFECTFAVSDVSETARLVAENGGRVINSSTIASVGHLLWFEDPAGNALGAMQYDAAAE